MDLVAECIGKQYSKKWALNNINFNIKTDNLALIGPNGSGKTTLLSIIAGLRYPSKGKLFLDGIEPYKERETAFTHFSYLFEKPKIRLRLKVSDLIKMLKEGGDAALVEKLTKLFGVESFARQWIGDLSSGQAQLCGLLVAMCEEGKNLILDEPFVHLDVSRAAIVLEELSRRKGIIIATHSLEEAEALANFFIIIDEGKVVWKGNTQDLYHEGIFEIFLTSSEDLPQGLILLSKFGRNALVKSTKEDLISLYTNNEIIGFKQAGLRYVCRESLEQ